MSLLALSRTGAPETSRAAADQNKSESQRQLILDYLRARGGATADEICVALDLPPNSVTPRMHELVGKNRLLNARGYQPQVVMTERRRPTRTGRMARVYEAV